MVTIEKIKDLEHKYCNIFNYDYPYGQVLLRIKNTTSTLGRAWNYYHNGPRGYRYAIDISAHFDVNDEVLRDTMIHEMLHISMFYNRIDCNHGGTFLREMNRINREYGFHLNVSYNGDNLVSAVTKKDDKTYCYEIHSCGRVGYCRIGKKKPTIETIKNDCSRFTNINHVNLIEFTGCNRLDSVVGHRVMSGSMRWEKLEDEFKEKLEPFLTEKISVY